MNLHWPATAATLKILWYNVTLSVCFGRRSSNVVGKENNFLKVYHPSGEEDSKYHHHHHHHHWLSSLLEPSWRRCDLQSVIGSRRSPAKVPWQLSELTESITEACRCWVIRTSLHLGRHRQVTHRGETNTILCRSLAGYSILTTAHNLRAFLISKLFCPAGVPRGRRGPTDGDPCWWVQTSPCAPDDCQGVKSETERRNEDIISKMG